MIPAICCLNKGSQPILELLRRSSPISRPLKNFFSVVLVLATGVALTVWLHGQLSVRLGFALLTQTDDVPVLASALFSVRNPAGVLVSEAGAAASEAIGRGRIFVDQRAVQTGVALVNPSDQELQVALTLRDSQGVEVGSVNRSVAPRASLVDNVSGFFGNLADGFTGSLTFQTTPASAGVAAVTLRQRDNAFGETLLATFPVADLTLPAPTDGELLFPQIGAGSILNTEIILVDRSGVESVGVIRLTGSDGNPLELDLDGVTGTSFPYRIAPNGTFAVNLTSPSGIRQGYATITPSPGNPLPFGTAVFQFTSGSAPISEAGVAAAQSTRRARLFVDFASTRTGVAVANPSGVPLNLTLTLRDKYGLSIESAQRAIPARGHFATFSDEIFPTLPEGFTGLLDIEAVQPFYAVTLKLTGNSRGDSILTTLPLASLDQPLAARTLVFPRLGFGLFGGGAFATRLILLNLDEERAFSGTLSFLQSAGGPLETPLSGTTGSEFPFQIPANGGRQARPGDEAPASQLLLDLAEPNRLELPVSVGDSTVLRPSVIDAGNQVRDDFEFTFSSVSPEVATIDALGRISAQQPGFTTITVAAGGLIKTVTLSATSVSTRIPGYSVDGVVQDRSRRLYLASRTDHAIWRADKVDTPPELWAGMDTVPGFLNRTRLESLFDRPTFLSLNSALGVLYVSDTENHSIRSIENRTGGGVSTLAGTGQAGYLDGPRTDARFNLPGGNVLDPLGNLWVADSGNHVIRRISLVDGVVETVAGRPGQPGLADGAGDAALFNFPVGIALESEPLASQLARQLSGDPRPPTSVIVADSGNGVLRRVFEDGRVETLQTSVAPARGVRLASAPPFPGVSSVAVDPVGDIFVAQPEQGALTLVRRDGPAVPVAAAGTFTSPQGLTVSVNGRLLVTDVDSSAREVEYGPPEIEEVTPGSVPSRGGMEVAITGRNFAPESIVIIADRTLTDVFQNTTELRFTVPALPSGLTTLTVQHRGGLAQTAFFVETSRLADLEPGQISTLAGGATFLGDGGPAVASSMPDPTDVAIDATGNTFVVETMEHRVRRIDRTTGVVTTVAGNGVLGYSGDGGPAVAASLCFPEGLTIDQRGNLLIADTANQRIREVDPSAGTITTVAGSAVTFAECTNSPGFSGDGGPALEAELNSPRGIVTDADGNLFIADGSNRRIRRVDAGGTIQTIAGTGEFGYTGDGGSALEATFGSLFGMTLDPVNHSLLIADRSNSAIRSVSLPANTIETIAGDGSAGFGGDGGPATLAHLNRPRDVAIDDAGTLLIADTDNHRIRQVNEGVISSIAGTGLAGFFGDGGPAVEAELNGPRGVVADNAGNVIIADTANDRLRQASSDGTIVSLAGREATDFSDEGQPAGAARLKNPVGLAVDRVGNLLVVDADNHRIVRIENLEEEVHTVAGNGEDVSSGNGGLATKAGIGRARGIAVGPDGSIYVTDTNTIRRIDSETGVISRFAGTGVAGFSGDGGPALGAALSTPDGLVFDGLGNLYVADTSNHRVRVIEADGNFIRTVAGDGVPGFAGDNGPALDASLSQPTKLAFDSEGRLYIADTGNQRIRRVDLGTRRIETVAGGSATGFMGDGGPATEAALGRPRGIALLADGTLLIADTANRRIRKVDTSGVISTVAGNGSLAFEGDNGPAREAGIGFPFAMVLDAQGDLIFTDAFHYRVRVIRSVGSSP